MKLERWNVLQYDGMDFSKRFGISNFGRVRNLKTDLFLDVTIKNDLMCVTVKDKGISYEIIVVNAMEESEVNDDCSDLRELDKYLREYIELNSMFTYEQMQVIEKMYIKRHKEDLLKRGITDAEES